MLRAERRAAFAFIAPSMIGVFVLLLIPVAVVVIVSMFRWNYLGTPQWVGLGNYARILNDQQAINSFVVAAKYVLMVVPTTTALALLFAIQLTKQIRGRTTFRVIFVLPWLTTPVVLGVIFSWIFHPRYGPAGEILAMLGLPGFSWFSDPDRALIVLAGVQLWQFLGYNSLLYMAGLQAIPEQIYEAAALDGAGPLRTLWSVTLPLVAPTTLFVVVTNVIGSFQVFDTVAVMTQGGPGDSTRVVNYLIYERAFKLFDAGGASALAVLLFFVLLVVTLIQFVVSRRHLRDLGE